tara:strand:+ start:382 stop:639 length:258 start_codon:yes stop_codon:yes gene_type:complete
MNKFKKLLSTIFFLPVVIVIGIFTASNTSNTEIFLWPFGKIINLPIWIIVIFSLFLGLLIGSFFMKLSAFFRFFKKNKSSKNISN